MQTTAECAMPRATVLTAGDNRQKHNQTAALTANPLQQEENNLSKRKWYKLWHHETGDGLVASGPPRLQDMSTHLENYLPTSPSVSPSDPGQPKADPPSQLRRYPDPIPPMTERCSVCCTRWVMEGFIQRKLRPTYGRRTVVETSALSSKTRG
ncbi:hypothetical protein T265_11860 [Opisthorchis viverrini]|uniref:Uncharacterized protein n=1 Tax=Opisthorchis viverrini TaxID=6198 RepID=A0A074Z1H1_OPIVI|nr:hypothetical protein T265_11860 [Opisthorchis viverrini]KER19332.1 hypothetical protein T265_11860 [Opisthorchis viverrini]